MRYKTHQLCTWGRTGTSERFGRELLVTKLLLCKLRTMALFFDQSFDLVKKISVETERDFIFNTNMVQITGENI